MEPASKKKMIVGALITGYILHKPQITKNRFPQLEANTERCFLRLLWPAVCIN